MTIDQIQEEIIGDLQDLETVEKYEYLINLGKLLPKLEEKYKIEKYKISGCQSRAWLVQTSFLEQNSEQKLNLPEKFLNNPQKKTSDFLINESSIQNSISNLNDKLFFTGFSDSQVVCGLLGLLWKIFEGQSKKEIRNSELFLVSRIGFDELITVRRQEGFWQIHKKIMGMCEGV